MGRKGRAFPRSSGAKPQQSPRTLANLDSPGARLSRMPQVTARELVRFLKTQGYVEDRQVGSHLTLWHEERNLSVTIPFTPLATLVAAWQRAS